MEGKTQFSKYDSYKVNLAAARESDAGKAGSSGHDEERGQEGGARSLSNQSAGKAMASTAASRFQSSLTSATDQDAYFWIFVLSGVTDVMDAIPVVGWALGLVTKIALLFAYVQKFRSASWQGKAKEKSIVILLYVVGFAIEWIPGLNLIPEDLIDAFYMVSVSRKNK